MTIKTAEHRRVGFSTAIVAVASLALVLAFLWFLITVGQVYACKCAEPGSPTEELEKFDAVFSGEVFSIDHSYDPDAKSVTPEDRSTIGMNVSTVWKGTVHEVMYITTPPTGGSCGFTFVEGEEYVVYASDSHYGDDSYTASICSRTALLAEAQTDIDELGEGQAPQAGTRGPAPVDSESPVSVGWVFALVLAAAILLVGLGGFVAYARIGRR